MSPDRPLPRRPEDERWMARALELARKGLGRVSPNPAVGAVVVKDGEVAGEGFHETFGGPHAEVVALEAALKATGGAAKGATLYVSLEPCRHEGKTPPCTDAILRAGIARVVYACADPNPEAAGGGALLGKKGVEVVEAAKDSALAGDARDFYAYFFKHILRGRPFVTAKWAMTADGRLATRTGDSRWVTSDESRAQARRLRAESDAVIVGVGTVLRDDPKLSARTGDGREPVRVIVDSALRTPPASELFAVAGGGVLVACAESAPEEREAALRKRGADVLRLPAPGNRVSLEALLDALHERGKLRLFLEGGGTILGAAFDSRAVDEVCVFMTPKVVGGKEAPGAVQGRGVTRMADALELTRVRWENIGADIMLRARVGEWDWME